MAKGRFIKSAERACASKTRFDSAQEAEAASMWRFRAYLCPVCHKYHLTSGEGRRLATPEPNPTEPPKPPGPKLGDLDWTAALNPQAKQPRRPKKSKVHRPAEPPDVQAEGRLARCTGAPGKDHRVHLVMDGRFLKSAPIKDKNLRNRLSPNVWILVSQGDPPHVLGLKVST